jgi:hypothetical protein
MSYLRHPALAVWTAIILAVAALIALALHLGGGQAPTAGPAAAAPTVPATASSARAQVEALRALMGSGTAAGADLSALQSFGGRPRRSR